MHNGFVSKRLVEERRIFYYVVIMCQMGNFVKDGVVYTLCPRDDVHCCSQRAPAAAAAAAASDDDVVRIGDDLYLVTAVDSPLNLSSDLSGQSINQSIRMSICISLHYLTTILQLARYKYARHFSRPALNCILLISSSFSSCGRSFHTAGAAWSVPETSVTGHSHIRCALLRCAGKTFLVFY